MLVVNIMKVLMLIIVVSKLLMLCIVDKSEEEYTEFANMINIILILSLVARC